MLVPPNVSTGGGGVGPHMNKFKQVSSDNHQMSLVGDWYWDWGVACLMSGGWAGTRVVPCLMSSH